MVLERQKYMLFTNTDFMNITGRSLTDLLSTEQTGNTSDYFITYVSNLITNYIFEMTGGREIFKIKREGSSTEYDLYFGFTEKTAIKLSDRQVEHLILACVYQADYIIDNGSTERMSGITMSTRGASKSTLKSFQICDMTKQLISKANLVYAGLGVGANAWFK